MRLKISDKRIVLLAYGTSISYAVASILLTAIRAAILQIKYVFQRQNDSPNMSANETHIANVKANINDAEKKSRNCSAIIIIIIIDYIVFFCFLLVRKFAHSRNFKLAI